MALLGRRQAQFVGQLAHLTGLNPQVVGAWARAEEGDGSGYEARGYNNFLNIAITDSGPRGGSNSAVWRDPVSAATATAEWLRGHGPIAQEYGKPAPGIRGILASAGRGAAQQIAAIAGSGWASSGYNNGANLRSTYQQLSGVRIPGGSGTVGGAGAAPRTVPRVLSAQRTESPGEPSAEALAQVLEAVKQLSGPAALGSPARPSFSARPYSPTGQALTPAPVAQSQAPDPAKLIEALFAGAPRNVSSTVSSTGPQPAGGETQDPQAGMPKGVVDFGGKQVAAWIAPILQYAKAHGWKGAVSSGYRSFAEQKRIYDSGVRPAAVPGTSNHEGSEFPRGAVDVSEAQQLSEILRRSPYGSRLVWAGGKDPVHFSHPHNGSY